jgi:hypothetical protein
MKVFGIFLSIFISINISAQDISKGANIIIVKSTSYEMVTKALSDSGFKINEKQSTKDKIVTTPQQYFIVKKTQHTKYHDLIMTIKFSDSTASITGLYDYHISVNNLLAPTAQDIIDGNYIRVENSESKKSFMRQSFNHMVDFAKSLKGEISFSKN